MAVEQIQGLVGSARQLSARKQAWTRWSGTPQDLGAFARQVHAEVAERSGDEPRVEVLVELSHQDQERYFDLDAFEADLTAVAAGTPGARLREIQAVSTRIASDELQVDAVFSKAAAQPGVHLVVEGTDRTLVSGLKQELARLVGDGVPRVPALPGVAQMLLGGLVGIGYAIAFYSMDWDFLPAGSTGDVIAAVLYLLGFIGIVYGLNALMQALLPPLSLTRQGEQTAPRRLSARLQTSAAWTLGLALLPFGLEQLFG